MDLSATVSGGEFEFSNKDTHKTFFPIFSCWGKSLHVIIGACFQHKATLNVVNCTFGDVWDFWKVIVIIRL